MFNYLINLEKGKVLTIGLVKKNFWDMENINGMISILNFAEVRV